MATVVATAAPAATSTGCANQNPDNPRMVGAIRVFVRRGWLKVAAVVVLMLGSTAAATRDTTHVVAHGSGEITISHANPDGTTTYDSYLLPTPPDGARHPTGARPVQPDMAQDPSNGSGGGACWHNTAQAAPGSSCPPWTWTYQGNPRPIVYFLDGTGSAWPVSSAASTWNNSLAIDSYWRPSSTTCPANVHCVSVIETNDISKPWCGQTHINVDSARHFIDNYVWITLNDYYFNHSSPSVGHCTGSHLQTACHELGHALGLDHNLYLGSCLYGEADSAAASTPNADDFWVLENISY